MSVVSPQIRGTTCPELGGLTGHHLVIHAVYQMLDGVHYAEFRLLWRDKSCPRTHLPHHEPESDITMTVTMLTAGLLTSSNVNLAQAATHFGPPSNYYAFSCRVEGQV